MIWGIALFVGCLALGLPIYSGLLAGGLYILLVVQGIPASMVVIGLYDGVSKFTLLAVPYFLLAGSLMEHSTMANRLVGCFVPWLVRIRGGIPMAGIMANELFGAISGSAPAAAGTIGRAMVPLVTKTNSEKFAIGLFTSAGSLAVIMPPSIPMILFATATNTSIGALFLAGVVPALIIGACLGVYVYFASPHPDESQKFSFKFALKKTKEGGFVLFFPVIVLGGIYLGIFTPTEAAAVSAVYAFVLPLLVYREIGFKEVMTSLKETVRLTGQIFILIAASTVFSQALAVSQVPAMLQEALSGISPFVFFVYLNLLLLLVGCFFDPPSAILVIAPIAASIAEPLGIDLLHLGIVFTVNLAIGMVTPPFGLNLFVIMSLFKKSLEQVARSVLPFIGVYLFALIIITYFPKLYLWLPKLWLAR
jgi:C4-dicarboxylate transporter DctM subunit